MTRTEHLLVILMEECDEVSQRASKALRFGLSEVQPGQEDPRSNVERLWDEFADLTGMMCMIEALSVSCNRPEDFENRICAKTAKVQRFLKYSEQCGTLKESANV